MDTETYECGWCRERMTVSSERDYFERVVLHKETCKGTARLAAEEG